ncbi:MAG: hypothetical protein QOI96_19 [Verrucomicrobiota bacterium]
MPLIDFRQALASPSDNAPLVVDHAATASNFEASAVPKQERTLATRLPRLHGSDRTSILFAILLFVGGLFCAFYFFNGAEILRAAAAWSREFLYPRPTALGAASNNVDISPEQDHPSSPIPPRDPRKSDSARTNDTAPFGRNVGSLYPSSSAGSPATSATAGLPSVTLPSDPGSFLGQLNLPPAGGGALAKTFDRAVAEIARVGSLYANAPIKVVQTRAKQASRKVNAQLKKTTQTARNAGARTNAVRQNAQNTQQQTSQTVSSTELQNPSATVISGDNLQGRLGMGSSGSGLGSSGLGVLGHGGAMGRGAAGIGGGIGGAVGGALGGLGGRR